MKSKKIAAVAVAMVMGSSACALALSGCGSNNEDSASSVVSMDINPGVEFVLDGNDKVVSVYGTNSDGQVLLYESTDDIIGKSFDEAVDYVTKAAVELNYLSEDNKVIQYSVSSTSDSKEESLKTAFESQITETSSSFNFNLTTDSDVAYSVYRKYEEYLTEHSLKAADLPVADFKLALNASESGTITLEAAVKLDKQELINYVVAASDTVKEYATKAYAKAKAAAEYAYDLATAVSVNTVYSTYYLSLIKSDTTKASSAHLGLEYTAYATSAVILDAMADAMQLATDVTNQVLGSDQTTAVLTALGLTQDDIAKIQDADGNVTIDSIEAYADKLFKNAQDSEAYQAIKNKLTTALGEAESAIETELAEVKEKYETELETVATTLNTAVSTVTTALPLAGQSTAGQALTQVCSNLTTLATNGITVDGLRTSADSMEKKAAETLEAIKADLTDDEYKALQSAVTSTQDKFASAKTTMDNAISSAETEAKAWLAGQKAARKQA